MSRFFDWHGREERQHPLTSKEVIDDMTASHVPLPIAELLLRKLFPPSKIDEEDDSE